MDDLHIGHVDLAPTHLALLGLDPDGRMDGRDFSREIRNGGGERPASSYLQAMICADQAAKDGLIEWRAVRTQPARVSSQE